MNKKISPCDPAPRRYPASVVLVRRSASGAACAPPSCTIDECAEWLLKDAMKEDDLLLLFESLVWRLVGADLPIDRINLSVGTLHPQLIGFGWNWNSADGLCDEVKIETGTREADAYLKSMLYHVIEHGERFRCKTSDAALQEKYPLIGELAEEGITEYIAVPMRTGGAYHNAVTIATRRASGFSDTDIAALDRIRQLFALHVERHIILRIAGNVMDTYLGHAAGEKVLHGAIKRGSGEPVCAVIWASDMRGFTDLSDRLAGPEVLAVLNAYFERQAGAVMAHGGEVLKFIGDGMLAVFGYKAENEGEGAAQAALDAAQEAMIELDKLNAQPPEQLDQIEGWKPLKCGIALHAGEVFFGNVGSPERLDFTVTGRAVNIAARIEALTKTLGRPILISEQVASKLSCPLDNLGRHHLRGLSEEIALYSP